MGNPSVRMDGHSTTPLFQYSITESPSKSQKKIKKKNCHKDTKTPRYTKNTQYNIINFVNSLNLWVLSHCEPYGVAKNIFRRELSIPSHQQPKIT